MSVNQSPTVLAWSRCANNGPHLYPFVLSLSLLVCNLLITTHAMVVIFSSLVLQTAAGSRRSGH